MWGTQDASCAPRYPHSLLEDGNMTLNRWLRRLLVLGVATLAITGMLVGASSSQDADDEEAIVQEKPKVDAAQAAKTLTITITAAENGQVASMTVGLAKLFEGPFEGSRLRQFNRRLEDVFAVEATPEQIVLRVDRKLNSGELIKVINVCERQKIADGGPIKKMSFVILGEE